MVSEPLLIAIPFVIVASVLIRYLSNNQNVNNDVSLGMIASVSVAIGMILIKLGQGFSVAVEIMLVGSMFTATPSEQLVSFVILS